MGDVNLEVEHREPGAAREHREEQRVPPRAARAGHGRGGVPRWIRVRARDRDEPTQPDEHEGGAGQAARRVRDEQQAQVDPAQDRGEETGEHARQRERGPVQAVRGHPVAVVHDEVRDERLRRRFVELEGQAEERRRDRGRRDARSGGQHELEAGGERQPERDRAPAADRVGEDPAEDPRRDGGGAEERDDESRGRERGPEVDREHHREERQREGAEPVDGPGEDEDPDLGGEAPPGPDPAGARPRVHPPSPAAGVRGS
ncbi:hypothetical protein BFL35_06880 [Clavibacter michiganensis]|nr:hypothetical protein BFL35_06880 [Clavibacter michiganensis]